MRSTPTAELFGLHAGDGTLYRTTRGIVWELRGDNAEKEFYDTYLVPLVHQLTARIRVGHRTGGKNGCYGIRSTDPTIARVLLDAGFPIGKKTATVQVPDSVRNGTAAMKAAFLRGLFATDGSLHLTRINGGRHPTYPRLELGTVSRALHEGVCGLLDDLRIPHTRWQHTPKATKTVHYLRITGRVRILRFGAIVGLPNPKQQRLLERIRNL